ncbi:hypothetical protein ACIBBD_26160 [Streptomyces sp. NPDC051315]|uniref:hypothetical protein n=1 Tax=Streptomyces sp. NPDC051315 TaxID=3365650 RepID=UPI0037B31152
MDKSTWSRERIATWESGKGFLLCLTVLLVLGSVAWLFLIKGLYLLPEKMCEGTLERSVVTQVLPKARSAEDGSDRRGAGESFSFSCYVHTSNDSSLWGRADVEPVTREKWLESYRGSGDRNRIVSVSVDGIEALARLDDRNAVAGVYVPCAPPVAADFNAPETYAVITEVGVDGDTEATGTALRQTLTDIAYRITERSYELAECKEARGFPVELPRYEDD